MPIRPTMTRPAGNAPPRRSWSSLEDRHVSVQSGRLAALGLLALAAVVAPLDVTDAERRTGVLACGAALLLHALLRQVTLRYPGAVRAATDAAIVVDAGLVLALALLSGGPGSPALWLLPLVALAPTLAMSWRSGVKAGGLGLITIGAVQALSGGAVGDLRRQAELALFLGAVVAVAAPLTVVNQREREARADRLRLLHEASRRLQETDDPDELMRRTAQAAVTLLPGWDLEVRAADAVAAGLRRADGRIVLDVPVTARAPAAAAAQTAPVAAVIRATRPAPAHGRARLRLSRVEALEALATALGAALTRADLVRQLERQSLSDALTGLANRRAFEVALEAELGRARRTGGELALALMDVDHFKRFNDTHGHQAGDAALVAVARVLAANARAGDHACRFGGEEFALLLPGADAAAARAAAERVRAAVAAAATGHGHVTVSVGVAVTDGRDGAAALVAAADARLYAAKAAGRDRVVAGEAVPDPASPPPGGAPTAPVTARG